MFLDVSLPRKLTPLKVPISHAMKVTFNLNPDNQRCARTSAQQHPMHMKRFYFLVLTWFLSPSFSLWHWISVQNFAFSRSKMAATVTTTRSNLPRKLARKCCHHQSFSVILRLRRELGLSVKSTITNHHMNYKFLKFLYSFNFQKRLGFGENNTKYRRD